MTGKSHVLVVEDDPDGREVIATILDHIDVYYHLASDAEQAEEHLFKNGSSQHCLAVVMDLALPGRDGWELLAEILNNPATQHIPCIAMTAYHTSKTRQEALSAGFTAYFSKPIDVSLFAQKLETLFRPAS